MSNPLVKREPIFDPAAGSFFSQMTTLLAALCLVFVVFVVFVYVKRETNLLLWGEPQTSRPALQPGQSTVIDGFTVKRLN